MSSNNSMLEFTFSWYPAIFEATLLFDGKGIVRWIRHPITCYCKLLGLAGYSSLCAAKSHKSFPGLVGSDTVGNRRKGISGKRE